MCSFRSTKVQHIWKKLKVQYKMMFFVMRGGFFSFINCQLYYLSLHLFLSRLMISWTSFHYHDRQNIRIIIKGVVCLYIRSDSKYFSKSVPESIQIDNLNIFYKKVRNGIKHFQLYKVSHFKGKSEFFFINKSIKYTFKFVTCLLFSVWNA